MAKVIGDLMAPNGKYIKDGEEKTRWLKCGILLQTDNGIRAKIECMPVGVPEDGLWLSCFEKRTEPAKPKPQSAEQDDIPF